jgi:hypothetical protein
MDNLHIIFGTRSILGILTPIEWELPLTGLEWTALKIKNQTLIQEGSMMENTLPELTEETMDLSIEDEEKAELRALDINIADEGI